MASPAASVSSEEEARQQYTGMATPQGSLEMVNCNVAGCEEQLPRRDLPVHLANHFSRMSEEFENLRKGMEKKIEALEQELDQKKCLEEDVRVVMQESKTHFAQRDELREEIKHANELAEQNREQARQVVEQIQQMATREDLALDRPQVAEQIQQVATRQELAQTQEETRQVAEQVRLMATRQELAQTQQTLRQTQEEVEKLRKVLGGLVALLVALVLAYFLVSPTGDGHLRAAEKIPFNVSGDQNYTSLAGTVTGLHTIHMKQDVIWSILAHVLPINITLREFMKHQKSNMKWESDPFYTHFRGYKMFLRVCANGCGGGAGTHVSVSVVLMHGEFDQELSWPFGGTVYIRSLNVSGNLQNSLAVNFSEATGHTNERVTSGESAYKGWGSARYLSYKQLPHFLDEDMMVFQLTGHIPRPRGTPLETKQSSISLQDISKVREQLWNEVHHELHRKIIPVNASDRNYTSLAFLHQFHAVQTKQEAMWSVMTDILPLNLTMENFVRHRKSQNKWYSKPFYTHFQGYKMCLGVDANGNGEGEGTHVSIFFHLMRGEFDDQLNWPFRGTLQIGLLGRSGDPQHFHFTYFGRDKGGNNKREISSEISPRAIGSRTYITHDQLEAKYLDSDSITFRVSPMALPDAMYGPLSLSQHISMWSMLTNVLPVNITMAMFSAYKTTNETWYSESFYTHFHGYKMCLNVDANGYGKSITTHVSVYIYMMRGEFDDKVAWPFEGELTIELLALSGKWMELCTVTQLPPKDWFTSTPMVEKFQRVFSGVRQNSGFGCGNYVSHSDLESTYLHNDSITFRVAMK